MQSLFQIKASPREATFVASAAMDQSVPTAGCAASGAVRYGNHTIALFAFSSPEHFDLPGNVGNIQGNVHFRGNAKNNATHAFRIEKCVFAAKNS